jgi:hypothetical protein
MFVIQLTLDHELMTKANMDIQRSKIVPNKMFFGRKHNIRAQLHYHTL